MSSAIHEGFSSHTMTGRGFVDDRYGVLDRLLNHRRDQGGTLAYAGGIQGSGKTTLLLALARAYMDQGETVLWKGRHIDAWHAFPGHVKIWSNYPIRLRRLSYDSDHATPLEDIPVHPFKDARDIIDRAERDCLNVVYAKPRRKTWDEKTGAETWVKTRFWDKMVRELTRKPTAKWHTLVLDEAHEEWPDRPEGADYHAQGDVRDHLADFRKTFNSLLMASHAIDEIDYRIMAKVQFKVYCRGCVPNGKSRVDPSLTLSLSPGEAIVESLYFARMTYPNIPRPHYQVLVEPTQPDTQNTEHDDERGGGG